MNLELERRYIMSPKACIIRFNKSCDLYEIARKSKEKEQGQEKGKQSILLKQEISSGELKPKRDIISRLKEIAAESFTAPVERGKMLRN